MLFNDEFLEFGARHSIEVINDKLVLRISNIQNEDAGTYSIAAVNRHGQDSVTFNVIVTSKIYISFKP